MIKIIETEDTFKPKPMMDMEPLEIAMIVDKRRNDYNHVVMRTASSNVFEVIDLTLSEIDECWLDDNTDVLVRPIDKPIMLELS